MKGIIAIKDDDQRFVVEAVHMLLEGEFQERAVRLDECPLLRGTADMFWKCRHLRF